MTSVTPDAGAPDAGALDAGALDAGALRSDEPGSDVPAATEPTAETVRRLTELFTRTVRQLGKAGMVEEASRTAGKAYVLLRECAPESAEHINGVMHFLARLPQDDLPRKDTP